MKLAFRKDPAAVTESSFRKQKKRIGRFIDRRKRYLAEREKELKDIIDLLAKAMVTLDTDKTLIDRADQVLYIAKTYCKEPSRVRKRVGVRYFG